MSKSKLINKLFERAYKFSVKFLLRIKDESIGINSGKYIEDISVRCSHKQVCRYLVCQKFLSSLFRKIVKCHTSKIFIYGSAYCKLARV